MMTLSEAKEENTAYFKEYVGALVCLFAAQLTEASEIEALFNAIDNKNDHDYNPEALEIRKELRDNLTEKINKYRDRFEAERAR